MAVTMTDLYPEPSWNFVYGQATLTERVGVQSFARYDPAFFGKPRPDDWRRTLTRRSAQVLVHELAHMFGLPHCVHWSCVVAGANHQAEFDAHPLHPCPVCLRKLWWNIGFDLGAREAALAVAWRRLGLDDEAAWSEARARAIADAR
jgi:archaemetzincin